AQEHGRLAVRRPVAGADPRAPRRRVQARPLRRPPGLGLDGRGPDEPAQQGTRDVPYRSLRLIPSRETRSPVSPMADIMTPALGESVTEATVARWAKKAGEAVRKDEIIVELETDKVSLEVASPADGVLELIAAEEGATV